MIALLTAAWVMVATTPQDLQQASEGLRDDDSNFDDSNLDDSSYDDSSFDDSSGGDDLA